MRLKAVRENWIPMRGSVAMSFRSYYKREIWSYKLPFNTRFLPVVEMTEPERLTITAQSFHGYDRRCLDSKITPLLITLFSC